MRRKNIGLMVLIVSLLFASVAYGDSDIVSKDTILADMGAANTREVLSKNNERIAYQTKYYINEGAVTIYTYSDQEKYYYH